MNEFYQQNPLLCCALLGLIFLLSGWLDYSIGARFLARCTWSLGVLALSFGIAGTCLFLGVIRWPIAAIVLIAGTYVVWRKAMKTGIRVKQGIREGQAEDR
jgi:hypothetical protein